MKRERMIRKKERLHRLRKHLSRMDNRVRQFQDWRRQPHQVAPMSDEEHDCATCGTHFRGNYCPRCGQASRIGRFSFKTGVLNFMDVWGLGNRGMFRTIRDLILRPGYMIRDYLSGMQMAYFPPFKMFFLLAAFSILVTHGFNIKGKDLEKDEEEKTETVTQEMVTPPQEDTATYDETASTQQEAAKPQSDEGKYTRYVTLVFQEIARKMTWFSLKFPNIWSLVLMMFVSGFLYLFFRRCPNIPDLRYAELFIALLYSVNMYSIYSIVLNFLALPRIAAFTSLLTLIPLKQFSGYSWWRTTLYTILSFVIMFALIFLILCASVCLAVYLDEFRTGG